MTDALASLAGDVTQADENLAQALDLLQPWTLEVTRPEAGRAEVILNSPDLLAAVKMLHEARWGHLTSITGLDPGAETGKIEILYHFRRGTAVLGLRLRIDRDVASVPSIYGILPSASFMEREAGELFGVNMVGLPPHTRLFLADDWPQGVYPLRKDFDPAQAVRHDAVGEQPAEISPRPGAPAIQPAGAGRFIIPIGPQHPALKEPGHFEFAVDGEIVTSASARLGYAHRGIEKAAEDRSWVQDLYLLERVCGICSHIHAMTYCQGVEQLAGVEVPPRAVAIRTIVAELERVHSHMLWFGVGAHEAGFDTLFMYAWRDRETVMDLLEGLSGNRVNYSVNLLGGVKFDIDDEQAAAILTGADFLEQRLHHYLDVATTDESFLMRTKGIGTMTAEQAEVLGTVGPTARASGVARDLRLDAPYAAYAWPDCQPNLVIETGGDLLARFTVRIKELFEGLRLIRHLVNHLPAGDLTVRLPRKIPAGETVSCAEAPRGELYYFIRSLGGAMPDRVKVRTPTLANWGAVLSTVVGHQLADAPMILAGVDPCFSCNDRLVSIRRNADIADRSVRNPEQPRLWTWEDLRRYGIDYYAERRCKTSRI